MPLKPRELEDLLQTKFGFSPAQDRAPDHRWYELQLPELPCILTKVSHNKKEIHSNLESKIARQLRVRTPYFKGMVSCTNSREDYYEKVREDPYPPWEHRF